MFSLRHLFPVSGYRWRQAWRPAITTTSPNSAASSCESLRTSATSVRDHSGLSTASAASPTAHCAGEGAQGHGPYWLLTWLDRDTGKSRGRTIPADAVDETRAQIAEYQRLRALVRELVEVSGPDMRCTAGGGQAGHAGKKGGLHSAIAEEVEAEVERLIGEGVLDDFQAVETEARRVALRLMGQAVARALNADHCDEQGPICPASAAPRRAWPGAVPRPSLPCWAP